MDCVETGLRAGAEKVKSVRAKHSRKTLFNSVPMRARQTQARKRGKRMEALALLVKINNWHDNCARNKVKLAEKEFSIATRMHDKAKTKAVETKATLQRMEAATQRLADSEKALNRRLEESTRFVREYQTVESEDDQRHFLISSDIETRMTAKNAARKKWEYKWKFKWRG
ncbi:hypothetical protein Golomagni_04075 [Golovinomyces magnicellulatus]|nr:hypothetical protein Golomagni_04075 [Golovinomyces magnicellulatus]